MPFTPFHMGPGLLAKAIAPNHISLQAFALSQIAMDIEAAVGMARGSDVLHGWTHTFHGSLLVVGATAVVWKLIEGRRLYRWTLPTIGWKQLAITMVVGAWTHVALDAFIHRDMVAVRELMGLERIATHAQAEATCLAMAISGVIILTLRWGVKGISHQMTEILDNLKLPPGWGNRPSLNNPEPQNSSTTGNIL